MNAEALYTLFASTFDPDTNVRISAELELKKVETQLGLLPVLLQLVSATPGQDGAQPVAAVILAATIYLKNRVAARWVAPDPEYAAYQAKTAAAFVALPDGDKSALRDNILPLIASMATDKNRTAIKKQLGMILAKVVDSDYPQAWPGLLDRISELLGQGDAQIEAGLIAAVDVFRKERYTKADDEEQKIGTLCATLFPKLLHLAQQILAADTPDAYSLSRQGDLLRLILKCYKHSVAFRLTAYHQSNIVPWGSVFLSVASKEVPQNLLPEDEDELQGHPWTKAQKWALYTLNRIYNKYGNPTQLPKSMAAIYGGFAQTFVTMFVPEIFKMALTLVERHVSGTRMGQKPKNHLIAFFEECIKPKSTWVLLKPHAMTLIERFIFPVVRLTDDEIEEFSEEPAEFCRNHFGDFIEDIYANPCDTGLSFLDTLVETRTSSMLLPVLNFIQTIVSKYPAETTMPQKDAAYRMLAGIAKTATKSKKLKPMMEAFLMGTVLPDFKSDNPILRYRACQIIEKFEAEEMTWANRTNLETVVSTVMECIGDPNLPVRIQAALTLPEFARYDEIRAKMAPNIARIMQEMLKLANEVDLDALTETMRTLVNEFSEEVVPFGVELCQSLIHTYERLLREILDLRAREAQGHYDDLGSEEKTLVCINILRTIDQLVSSLGDSPASLSQIEGVIVPNLIVTIQANLVELYEELYSILDNLVFSQASISQAMWPVFEATYHSFKTDAEDAFDQLHATLDNFVCYGAPVLATNPTYRNMLVDVFTTVMNSPQLGAEERALACQLGEAVFLNLKSSVEDMLAPLLVPSLAVVLSTNPDEGFVVTERLHLHAINLFVAAFAYNTGATLAFLEQQQVTAKFFTEWFNALKKLGRVYDRKLSIVALSQLLEFVVANSGVAPTLRPHSIVLAALEAFRDLPDAFKVKNKLKEDFANADEDDDDEEDDDDDDGAEEKLHDDDEEVDVVDGNVDYFESVLAAKANKEVAEDGSDDGASLWSEEILWKSPLDDIDVFAHFTRTLAGLEHSNLAAFQQATEGLQPGQRAELSNIAEAAHKGGERIFSPPAPPGSPKA